MHIIFGIIGIIIGFLITWKSESILNSFGRINFFENKLGPGGSHLGYKLIGIFVILIGVLTLTNLIGGFMRWILSPLLRLS